MKDRVGIEIYGDLWKCGGHNMIYECSICGSIHNVFPYGSDASFFCIGSLTGIEARSIKRIDNREKEIWRKFGNPSRYHQVWEMTPRNIEPHEERL